MEKKEQNKDAEDVLRGIDDLGHSVSTTTGTNYHNLADEMDDHYANYYFSNSKHVTTEPVIVDESPVSAKKSEGFAVDAEYYRNLVARMKAQTAPIKDSGYYNRAPDVKPNASTRKVSTAASDLINDLKAKIKGDRNVNPHDYFNEDAPADYGLDPDGIAFIENPVFDNPYAKKPVVVDENRSYRAFLTQDKQTIIYVSCPAGYKGSADDVILRLQRGDKDFVQLDGIPKKKGEPMVAPQRRRGAPVFAQRAPVARGVITKEQFVEKNSHLFTVRTGSLYLGDKLSHGTGAFHNTIMQTTCASSVAVSYNMGPGLRFVGFTTGKFDRASMQCEIVGMEVGNNVNILSKLKRQNIHYSLLNCGLHSMHKYFYKVKIVTSDESADLFGFKNIKKKMVDKVYSPLDFIVVRGYFCKKLERIVDVVEIKNEKGTWLKFLTSELEFLSLNYDAVGTGSSTKDKQVKKGSKIKIVDDRRISLKKNDQFVVTRLVTDSSCMKNSLVTLRDDRGEDHVVLLKQVKVI